MSRDAIDDFLATSRALLARLDGAAIERMVHELGGAWRRSNTVFTFGNGGSAGTAQHLAADLFQCTRVDGAPPVRALSLNDNGPLLSALTNDLGWESVYERQLETWFSPGDVVFAISVHGGAGSDRAGPWSQNVLRACRYAKQRAGRVLAFVGHDGGPLAELADVAVVVPSDATPHVEGLHVVLHHLVTARLRAFIEDHRAEAAPRPQENSER